MSVPFFSGLLRRISHSGWTGFMWLKPGSQVGVRLVGLFGGWGHVRDCLWRWHISFQIRVMVLVRMQTRNVKVGVVWFSLSCLVFQVQCCWGWPRHHGDCGCVSWPSWHCCQFSDLWFCFPGNVLNRILFLLKPRCLSGSLVFCFRGKPHLSGTQLPTCSHTPAHCGHCPLTCLSQRKDLSSFKADPHPCSFRVLRPPGPHFLAVVPPCVFAVPVLFQSVDGIRDLTLKKSLTVCPLHHHLSFSLFSKLLERRHSLQSLGAVPCTCHTFLNFKLQTYRKVTRICNWHPHTPHQVHQLLTFCPIYFLVLITTIFSFPEPLEKSWFFSIHLRKARTFS